MADSYPAGLGQPLVPQYRQPFLTYSLTSEQKTGRRSGTPPGRQGPSFFANGTVGSTGGCYCTPAVITPNSLTILLASVPRLVTATRPIRVAMRAYSIRSWPDSSWIRFFRARSTGCTRVNPFRRSACAASECYVAWRAVEAESTRRVSLPERRHAKLRRLVSPAICLWIIRSGQLVQQQLQEEVQRPYGAGAKRVRCPGITPCGVANTARYFRIAVSGLPSMPLVGRPRIVAMVAATSMFGKLGCSPVCRMAAPLAMKISCIRGRVFG